MMKLCIVLVLLGINNHVCLSQERTIKRNNGVEFTFRNLPEASMTVEQIIRHHGYAVENHNVVTADGYVLSLKRIPQMGKSKKPKLPVFLQHGIVDSATTWVFNGKGKSLAYMLADEGHDVWLGNSRGNTYAKKHVKYSTNSHKFWDFSFEELAKYDLPASINYVLNVTNAAQLHYVGHSQGSTIGFIEFSRNHELGKKIKQFIALAPVATITHIKGLLGLLAKKSATVELILKLFGVDEFMPSNFVTKLVAKLICTLPIADIKCAGFMFLIAGFNTKNLDMSRISIYLAHTPAGTSVKDLSHFAQVKRSGQLAYYDYGYFQNLLKYGQSTPPLYDISKMQVPVALFTASNDWLATPRDIDHSIRGVLTNINHDENLHDYNHLDFVWGKDAAKRVYTKIISLFRKAESS